MYLESERSLYDERYFANRSDSRRKFAYVQDAQTLRSRNAGAPVLDLGCGTGEFGDYIQNEYYGYDPFTRPDVPLPGNCFGTVVFRGTLQHMYNPVEMLHFSFDHLFIGGMLAILATPDTDSLGYMRWGTLPALDPYRNWIPFGHRMLDNILRRIGFTCVDFEWPYGKPYARPLKNLWNFIIGKPDAFPGNMMNCFARK